MPIVDIFLLYILALGVVFIICTVMNDGKKEKE